MTTQLEPTRNISSLKTKTCGEIIAKWNQDLEGYSKEFHSQAIQVQKWDVQILENRAQASL